MTDAEALNIAVVKTGHARFRDLRPLAEFDWNFNPAISRVQIETLAACDFVRRRQNLSKLSLFASTAHADEWFSRISQVLGNLL